MFQAFRGHGRGSNRELLIQLDLPKLEKELRAEIDNASGQKRANAIKRLEVVEAFLTSGNKPEWIILTVIPVIPPEIRPMVQLDGGRFATSDLNDLYRRVINLNRSRDFLSCARGISFATKAHAAGAVDSLIDYERRTRLTRPGKPSVQVPFGHAARQQGLPQNSWLAREYSGRSVIGVGRFCSVSVRHSQRDGAGAVQDVCDEEARLGRDLPNVKAQSAWWSASIRPFGAYSKTSSKTIRCS
jgi:DNA-directed RNA polymerase subunit beta'